MLLDTPVREQHTETRPLTRQIRRDMERHKTPRRFVVKRGGTTNVFVTGFAYTCARCPARITDIDEACLVDGHVSHQACPTTT